MVRKTQQDIAMAEPDTPSTSAAPAACQFPSVKTNAPLVDSYTFHSVDKEVTTSVKGKEVEQPVIEGEWMLGVDEAGRGPVLGELARFLSLIGLIADWSSPQQVPKYTESRFASWSTLTSSSRWALPVSLCRGRVRRCFAWLTLLLYRFQDSQGPRARGAL